MALKDYEASRGKVSVIQRRLNETIEEIRNHRLYSDSGRRTEMAKATLQAKREVDALKAKNLAEREARRESLEKRLFGILGTPKPDELMVMRDSYERADKITSEEDAHSRLRLANQMSDAFMAKAIAARAATRGWIDVVNAYAENAPLGTKTALEELSAIPSGLRTNIADATTFSIRNPPRTRPRRRRLARSHRPRRRRRRTHPSYVGPGSGLCGPTREHMNRPALLGRAAGYSFPGRSARCITPVGLKGSGWWRDATPSPPAAEGSACDADTRPPLGQPGGALSSRQPAPRGRRHRPPFDFFHPRG